MAKQKKPVPPEFLAFEARPRVSPWIGALSALWGAAVLAAYRPNHLPFLSPSYWLDGVPPFWLMSASAAGRHLGHLAALAAFATLSVLLGRGFLRRAFKVEGLNVFETLSYGFGLGLGALALTTFGLGALQLLKPGAVFTMTAGLAGLAVWLNRGPAPSSEERGAVLRGPACVALAAVTALLLGFQCYHALAPEVSFDALVYHLGLPNLYRLNGGLTATPTVAYSGFPMLIEWAYAWALFFSDEISAKLLHWACAAGVAAAFLGLGARRKRPLIGWIACVVFLGASISIYNVTKAAVDMGSAFFTLLAASSLALHLSRRSQEPRAAGALELSAAFCGLALGVKYINWPLLPLTLIVLAALGEPKRNLIRYGLIALALLTPWIVKNLALYHNPVFPFFQEALAPNALYAASWRRLREDAWGRNWAALFSDGPALIKALLHPWFLTIEGVTEFDSVGPVFLIGLAGLVWLRPASVESRFWLWIICGLWTAWWTTSAMPRFFMPGLCLLSVVLGVVIERVPNRWARSGLLALIAGFAFDGAADYSAVAAQTGNQQYLLGDATKDEYLRHTHTIYPAAYFNAAEWLGRNTPAGARALLLNGGRGCYLDRPFLASSQLDEDLLAHWLKSGRTAEDLLGEFRRNRVSYLLVNMAWVWRGDPDPAVTPERQRALRDFFDKYARLRYRDVDRNPADFRWVLVYEIGPAPEDSLHAPSPLSEWYRVGGATGLGPQGRVTIE